MMRHHLDERGMTLVELLVAASLLCLVAIAMWALTSFGFSAVAHNQPDLTTTIGQRAAISNISRDARGAASASISPDGRQLTLTLGDSSTVSYSTSQADELIRSAGGSTRVVVREVGTVTFAAKTPGQSNPRTIVITVVSTNGKSLTASITGRRP